MHYGRAVHTVRQSHNAPHFGSSQSEKDPMPEFSVCYLSQSNPLIADAAEPEVRNALLAIASLPIRGQDLPFHAYEAIGHNQIRGIIRNAGDMIPEELMNSLHCRKCKILQARTLGDKGTPWSHLKVTAYPTRSACGHLLCVFFRTVHEWPFVTYVTRSGNTRCNAPILWQRDLHVVCGNTKRAHSAQTQNRSGAVVVVLTWPQPQTVQKDDKPIRKLNKNASWLPKVNVRNGRHRGVSTAIPRAEKSKIHLDP